MANTEVLNLSVSDTSSSVSFTTASVLTTIKNIGSNKCFFNLNATATTDHFQLDPDDEITIGYDSVSAVHAICNSGETTTLRIIGRVKV